MGTNISRDSYEEINHNILDEVMNYTIYCAKCEDHRNCHQIVIDSSDIPRCKDCNNVIFVACKHCSLVVLYTSRYRHYCYQHNGGEDVFKR